MGATLTGGAAFKSALKRFSRAFPDEVASALYKETQIEATEVKRRTPVWNSDRRVPAGVVPGALRASVRVIGPVRRGTQVYTLIAAGGNSAPYAIYVHEDLDAFHKVGQAKYIESVILESRSFMAIRVAKRIDLKRALAGESSFPATGPVQE